MSALSIVSVLSALRASENLNWDYISNHDVITDAEQVVLNGLVDDLLESIRTVIINEKEEYLLINYTQNPLKCPYGRVGRLSSIQRIGPTYIYSEDKTGFLKVDLGLRGLEFEFENCKYTSSATHIDLKGLVTFYPMKLEISLNGNKTCKAGVKVRPSGQLGKVLITTDTQARSPAITDMMDKILSHFNNSTINAINDKVQLFTMKKISSVNIPCAFIPR